MRVLLIVISIFTVMDLSSQTCIIARKTKKTIYVGADSRGTPYSYNPLTKKTTRDTASNLCKIYSSGKFNFAASGVGFPMAMEAAKKTLTGKKNFMEWINAFVTSFGKALSDTLEKYRTEKPNVFQTVVPVSKKLSRVIFFGVEADTLYLAQVDLYLKSSLNEKVDISAGGGPNTIIVAGHGEKIKDIVFKESTWREGDIRTIKRLIKVEADANKMEVGGDIDIIKITIQKTEWIQKKKICN